MNKEMVLVTDEQIISINSAEEMQKACENYSKPEQFRSVSGIRAIGFSNNPICADILLEEHNIPTETCSKMTFIEGMEETGIFLIFPNEEGTSMETRSLLYTAINSVYDRAGVNCRLIRTIENKGFLTALSAEERGKIIDLGFQQTKETFTVYIPNEKIGFIGSEVYVPLMPEEGRKEVQKMLDTHYPDAQFAGGQLSHEYIYGNWELNALEEEESYALMLKDYGVKVDGDRTPFILRYQTSNVGNSKMSARLFIELNGVLMPLGKAQSVWHSSKHSVKSFDDLNYDNGCSISAFAVKLGWIGKLLKENEDIIEKLGNTTIQYPSSCLYNLLKECNTIPESQKRLAVEEMELEFKGKTCTAIDVYLKASAIAATGDSPTKIINMSEEIASMQFKDFKAYDKIVG